MNKKSMLKMIVFCLLLAVLTTLTPPASAKITKQSLHETEAKVKSVVARALPCTVGLTSQKSGATGSGVIVSSDGLILTAGHVTRATGDDITVFLPDGRRLKAKALGANYGRDASMAKIVGTGEFPFVDVGDSKSLKMDQWCISLGHAAGFQPDRSAPIRLGRILGRNLVGYVKTDCTLIGGDSGGPLFDLDGKLIGIHSNIGRSLSENNHVPITVFKSDWDRMVKGERWGRLLGAQMPQNPNRPMLGVQPGGSADGGVRVDVIDGASAARAGLKNGDIIKSIGGKATPDTEALLGAITSHKAGQKVDVVVLRGEEELTIEVRLMRARDVRPPTPPEDDGQPSDGSDDQAEDSGDAQEGEAAEQSDEVEEEDPDELLNELVEQAQQEGESLELTPEQLAKLGGMSKFLERMGKIAEDYKPQDLARLMGVRAGEDTFFSDVITAYRPVVAPASRSVHRLMKGKRQVALGTAVQGDGYVLTKASEVTGHDITVKVNDKLLPATLQREFPDYDLALMKVDAELVPIAWDETDEDLALGSFLSVAGPDDIPLAVGLISVAERDLSGKNRPFLGVGLKTARDGLQITNVQGNSAAAKADLKTNDVITSMDGKHYDSVQKFIDDLQKKRPGDKIKLQLLRDGEEMDFEPLLGDRSIAANQGPSLGMYPQGGRLSENRGGYPSVLQTDLPIEPQECGSPVVGLDGRSLGINIARAGRIKSYAIPAAAIRQLLEEALPEKR